MLLQLARISSSADVDVKRTLSGLRKDGNRVHGYSGALLKARRSCFECE